MVLVKNAPTLQAEIKRITIALKATQEALDERNERLGTIEKYVDALARYKTLHVSAKELAKELRFLLSAKKTGQST